jgi:very-short-patch-repair endonuclease
VSATLATRTTRALLEKNGLPVGTSLEDTVTWRLHRWNCLDRTQYRVGPYRLDYAWAEIKVALEADGPHHWRPDIAIKDVTRDAYLRARGWLVFRIHNTSGTLEEQMLRVVVVVKNELDRSSGQGAA